jgi:hypothetical protein
VLSFRPHHGAVAQLVAHLVRNEGVRGSSPLSSTETDRDNRRSGPFPIREEGVCGVWGEVQQQSTAAKYSICSPERSHATSHQVDSRSEGVASFRLQIDATAWAGIAETINVVQVEAMMVTTHGETPGGAMHRSRASMAKRFRVVQDGCRTALDLEPRGSILFKCSGKRWSGYWRQSSRPTSCRCPMGSG